MTCSVRHLKSEIFQLNRNITWLDLIRTWKETWLKSKTKFYQSNQNATQLNLTVIWSISQMNLNTSPLPKFHSIELNKSLWLFLRPNPIFPYQNMITAMLWLINININIALLSYCISLVLCMWPHLALTNQNLWSWSKLRSISLSKISK